MKCCGYMDHKQRKSLLSCEHGRSKISKRKQIVLCMVYCECDCEGNSSVVIVMSEVEATSAVSLAKSTSSSKTFTSWFTWIVIARSEWWWFWSNSVASQWSFSSNAITDTLRYYFSLIFQLQLFYSGLHVFFNNLYHSILHTYLFPCSNHHHHHRIF